MVNGCRAVELEGRALKCHRHWLHWQNSILNFMMIFNSDLNLESDRKCSERWHNVWSDLAGQTRLPLSIAHVHELVYQPAVREMEMR